MSIAVDIPIRRKEWGGDLLPNLPVATWVGEGSVTGNGTGGTMIARLEFQPASAGALDSNMYSLEQLMLHKSTAGVAQFVLVQTLNMGERSGSHAWAVELVAVPLPVDLAMPGQAAMTFPVMIGSMITPGTQMVIAATAVNDDTSIMTFQAEGYVWDARARSWLGGPKRPPGAFYGS